MKPLVIFATLAEAQTTLEQLQAKEASHHLWRSEPCELLICGMGSYNALQTLSKALEKGSYSELYNLGCCADLLGRSWGQLYHVTRCAMAMEHPAPLEHSRLFFERLFPAIEIAPLAKNKALPSLENATLLSVDCPVHDTATSERLKAFGELVDMEGYALSWLAQQQKLPLELIKCTSDFGNPKGPGAIRASLSQISERLWQALKERL